MKNVFIAIFAFLSVLSYSSTTVSMQQIDSVKIGVYGDPNTQFIVRTSDEYGRCVADTLYVGFPRVLTGLSEQYYDSNSRLTTRIIKKYISGNWVNYEKHESIYGVGDEFTENRYAWSGSDWTLSNTSTYEKTFVWGNYPEPIEEISKGSTTWHKTVRQIGNDNSLYYEYKYTSQDNGVTWNPLFKMAETSSIGLTYRKFYEYEYDDPNWVMCVPVIKTEYYYHMIDTELLVTANKAATLEKINISPNPCKGVFFLETEQALTIELFNLSGSLLLSKEMLTSGYVSLDGISKGIYVVKLSNDKEEIVKKIIVE
jgi:hypothetical protein